jgi:hypothetical protein
MRFISDYQLYSICPLSSTIGVSLEEEEGNIRHRAFVKAETRAGGSDHQLPPILTAQIVSTT